MIQRELGLAADAPQTFDGERQCACGVWMTDDARPHCAVCETRRGPHVVARGDRWVWVEGEKT